MSKTEFLTVLRQALSMRVEAGQVNEHMRYYEDYINTQIRLGRTEEEVIADLGDPRLIAKTIGDTQGAGGSEPFRETERPERPDRSVGNFFHGLPMWGRKLLILGALILIIMVVASLLSFLMPIILALCVVAILFDFFRRLR